MGSYKEMRSKAYNPYYPYDVELVQSSFREQGQPKCKTNMDVWNPYSSYELGANQDFLREPELQCKPTRYPHVNLVDEQSLPNLAQSTDMDYGTQMKYHMMNSRYNEAVETPEEKFKKALHQFEELIHHEVKDCDFSYEIPEPVQHSPFSKAPEVMQTLSPGFDALSPIMNNSAGYDTLVNNRLKSSSYLASKSSLHNVPNIFPRPPSGDDIMLTSVSCNGNNICTHETAKQDPFEAIPSPEPISTVTACSDSDRQSDNYPSQPIEAGSVIMDNAWQYHTEASTQDFINGSKHIDDEVLFNQTGYHADHPLGLEGNMEVPYLSLRASNQVMGQLSRECKVYPSVIVNRTASGSEEVLYPQIQLPGPRHCCYHPPINLLGYQPDVHSQTCLVAPDELSKLIDSCNVSSYDILLQYKAYKNSEVNVGKFQVPVLSYLHWTNCSSTRCQCKLYQLLISHFDSCNDSSCNVCSPPLLRCSNYNFRSASGISNNSFSNVYGDNRPPAKRMRVENLLSSYHGEVSAPGGPVPEMQEMTKKSEELLLAVSRRPGVHHIVTNNNQQLGYSNTPYIAELVNQSYELQKVEHKSTSEIISAVTTDNIKVSLDNHIMELESEKKDVVSSGDSKSEATSCLIEHTDNIGSLTGLQESKKVGVSLVDILTADQIEEHIYSLGNVTNEMSTDDILEHSLGKSLCQLCATGELLFNPVPVYCSFCGSPIKGKLTYYWTSDEMGGKHCFCGRCFRKSRGKSISVQGLSFCKSNMNKGKNIEKDEESWVQCDKCEGWQHQICGLYNSRNDSEGKAKYICPSCRLLEIQIGEHMPLCPPFGAKDLPCTKLSDHIEQRLHKRLKEERQERAVSSGKCVDEVPGAENLVVRVVLSVNKLVKVKQQFLDIFHGENYPAEFPYKSKLILLFQKIKGVDVCLFGMYVQEYGSDCQSPNQRSVYISYLDSVKYFQPEIRTVHGEALRTFVYHEILIGYLDYCKKLGFETCYIWACPPVKDEDFILYCHPETQKTPKSDKLRHWYKSMLRKATKENVVLDSTNFYDRFFVPNSHCSRKVTTANLPYFDGAYWSGAAEDLNRKFGKEGGGSETMAKKPMSNRTLKSMGHADLSGDSATDILVMQKLGQDISRAKEDFIIVHLQFSCSSCHKFIQSPNHWLCAKCKSFRVCPRCINLEQSFSEKTHFISGEQHALTEIVVHDVPLNTDDEDGVLDNDIFSNRHSFLSFCQENHYQFDSLRRAKYSSMMILYHLHKQISLGLVTVCSICQKGVKINDGWRCDVCPGITVCSTCYQREGNHGHIHDLTQSSSMNECGTKNKRLQKKNAEMEEILKTLVHSSQCQHSKEDPCSYSGCYKMRKLFHHISLCKDRVDGGCQFCKMAWILLHSHSRNCMVTDCRVPNCQSIKMSRNLKATLGDNRLKAALLKG